MQSRNEHKGFTLVEMMVVVAIVAVMGLLVLPNIPEMLRSQRMSSAQNLIKNALVQAQAYAAEHNTVAGIRFQFNSDGWKTGRQYLVLVEKETESSEVYVDVPNVKPTPLPNGIGAMSALFTYNDPSVWTSTTDPIEIASRNNLILRDYDPSDGNVDRIKYCIDNMTTFTILFSSTGQLVTKDAILLPRDPATSLIFGVKNSVESKALNTALLYQDVDWSVTNPVVPWCPRGGETSATGMYLFTIDAMVDADPMLRYSDFISQHVVNQNVEEVVLNLYTGMIIQEEY